MAILVALQQWIGEQIVPVFLTGFAIMMGVAMMYISARNRRSSLVRDRSGRTEDTFVESLAPYGFDLEIARSTYRYMQEHRQVAFPILPSDELDRDLGLDDDEVKTAVRDLLQEVGREYLPGLLEAPLISVVDVVRYIQASPRRIAIVRRRTA